MVKSQNTLFHCRIQDSVASHLRWGSWGRQCNYKTDKTRCMAKPIM